MSDENENADPLADPVVELACQLMTWNFDQTTHIGNQLLAAARAEADRLELVRQALDTIPFGGTTASYEAGLRRIESALCPPMHIQNVLIERARQFVAGEEQDPFPEMFPSMRGIA